MNKYLTLMHSLIRGLTKGLLVVAVSTLLLSASPVRASQERHALVIANTDYDGGFELYNPALDASAIATKLSAIGYTLYGNEVKSNLKIDDLGNLVTRFFNSVPDGSSTFIYYAGHGVAVDGANYIVPILPAGVSLRSKTEIKNRTYALNNLINEANHQNPSGVNVILIDACRDAPVERSVYRSVNLLDGMAKMAAPPEGTFVGFSAEYGKKALDGRKGEHSPYAREVLFGLEKQASMEIELFHKNVADRVFKRTGGKQYPIYEPRIRGRHCLVPCGDSNTELPLLNYGVLHVETKPANASVCFLMHGNWNCSQGARHHPIGSEVILKVSAKNYKDSQHRVVLTESSQKVQISLQKRSSSMLSKIGIGVAAIIAIGLLSGGDDGPDTYPITLVPPGSQ